MVNFPTPYHNELVYSTVARAGVHHGIASPKQLLDEVFGDRKIIATVSLPSHLQDIARHLKNTGRHSEEELIYQHTLFPLYAPFVTEERKNIAVRMMRAQSRGAVHLMLGVAASRIQSSDHFRYCSECMKIQRLEFGEHFWQRNWYFPGLSVCAEHGALTWLPERTGSRRHQFWPLIPRHQQKTTADPPEGKNNQELCVLAKVAEKMLAIPPGQSPSFDQWTEFYRDIASKLGFCRGRHISHHLIHSQVNTCFTKVTLSQLNLHRAWGTEACWLKGIFRKHRKAFSYLEHAIVWQGLLGVVEPSDIVAQVRTINAGTKVYFNDTVAPSLQKAIDRTDLINRRQAWIRLVEQKGVNSARKRAKGGGLYAWLYRHDKPWLLEFNATNKTQLITSATKLDWHHRDVAIVRSLRKFLRSIEMSTERPRVSSQFLLNSMPKSNSIQKNIDKLPLARMFMQRYTETVTEHQLRRMANTYAELVLAGDMPKRWVILRKAGLSEERLTPIAKMVTSGLKLF